MLGLGLLLLSDAEVVGGGGGGDEFFSLLELSLHFVSAVFYFDQCLFMTYS